MSMHAILLVTATTHMKTWSMVIVALWACDQAAAERQAELARQQREAAAAEQLRQERARAVAETARLEKERQRLLEEGRQAEERRQAAAAEARRRSCHKICLL